MPSLTHCLRIRFVCISTIRPVQLDGISRQIRSAASNYRGETRRPVVAELDDHGRSFVENMRRSRSIIRRDALRPCEECVSAMYPVLGVIPGIDSARKKWGSFRWRHREGTNRKVE
jgi:hypothetical protein